MFCQPAGQLNNVLPKRPRHTAIATTQAAIWHTTADVYRVWVKGEPHKRVHVTCTGVHTNILIGATAAHMNRRDVQWHLPLGQQRKVAHLLSASLINASISSLAMKDEMTSCTNAWLARRLAPCKGAGYPDHNIAAIRNPRSAGATHIHNRGRWLSTRRGLVTTR